ncbi:MAG: hypothetical protein Q4C58_11545 [Eubacteriales bacterium]|nr:hypothetical protein [Eubacteriales bacterium]
MKRMKIYIWGLAIVLYFILFFVYLTWENRQYFPQGPAFVQTNDYPAAFSGGN